MTRHRNRRKVERIPLLPHVPGVSGSRSVEMIEISMGGARLQHYHPIKVGSTIDLHFEWDGEEIAVPALVVRSSVELFGATSVYLSGLKFVYPDEKAKAKVRKLIGFHVKLALDRQIANAEGTTFYSSRLLRDAAAGDVAVGLEVLEQEIDPVLQEMRDRGYVRYTRDKDGWSRKPTTDPGQPTDGFTIWMFEDDEQAELLCLDYDKASQEMRDVIRLCAELSLVIDDRIPVQHFRP